MTRPVPVDVFEKRLTETRNLANFFEVITPEEAVLLLKQKLVAR